jgi:hypothetical protein
MDWQTIAITAFLAWAGWISITVLKANSKAEKSLANDEQNQKEITTISEGMKDLKDGLQRIETRVDLFLKTELDTLKQIAQK